MKNRIITTLFLLALMMGLPLTAFGFTVTLTDANVAAGTTSNFTPTVSGGTTPYSYVWEFSTNGTAWTAITSATTYTGHSGNTSREYAFPTPTPPVTLRIVDTPTSFNTRLHRVVVTDRNGEVAISNSGRIAVHVAPVITTHPANKSIAAGQDTEFAVVSSNTPAPDYQWQLSTDNGGTWVNVANSGIYSGATTAKLTLTNATTAVSGNQYRCQVSNVANTTGITSNAATLTVSTLPVFTPQPTPGGEVTIIAAIESKSFTVGTSGTAPITYQWKLSTNGTTWANVPNAAPYSGATTNTLTLTNVNANLNNNQYRCEAMNAATVATGTPVASNPVTLKVISMPSFTNNGHPADRTVTAGSTATTTFSVALTPNINPTPALQWQLSVDGGTTWENITDDGIYTGATTSTLTLTGIQFTLHNNKYRCVATNAATVIQDAPVASNAATLTVNTKPGSLLTLTNPTIIVAGDNTVFDVGEVSGDPPPAYQWKVATSLTGNFTNVTNNNIYSGATSHELKLTNVPANFNNYRFQCEVKNAAETVLSNIARLEVHSAPSFTGSGAVNPTNKTVNEGLDTSFNATASGNPVPNYQWQVDDGTGWRFVYDGPTGGVKYAGADTNELKLEGVTAEENLYKYRCVATNVDVTGETGTAYSNVAVLTVNFLPIFEEHPIHEMVDNGDNHSFTVKVRSNPAPSSYRWQVYDGTGWVNLSNTAPYSGTNTDTLTLTNIPVSLNNNRYRCVVTNSRGTVESDPAVLTVTNKPKITTQPANSEVDFGSHAVFLVAANGEPPLTYQWQVSTDGGATFANITDGGVYSGTTTAMLMLTNTTLTQNGYRFRCVVENAYGSVLSNSAALIVREKLVFETHPVNRNITVDSTTSFYALAKGNPEPSYQWQISKDGGVTWSDLANNGVYSLTNTHTLMLSKVPISENDNQYRCVAENSSGKVYSNVATLKVAHAPAAPLFTTQPVNQNVVQGSNTAFTVVVSGYPEPEFRWELSTNGGTTWNPLSNGTIYSGVQSATLTLTNIPFSANGNQYRCVATNNEGTTTSSPASLVVTRLSPFSTHPANQSAYAGGNVSFTAETDGEPAPTYQWQISTNGTIWNNVPNNSGIYSVTTSGKRTTLTLTGVTVALNNNLYRCVATNAGGSVTSDAATLTITEIPSFSTHPPNRSISNGQNASFNVTVIGTPEPSLQWEISTDGGVTWSTLSNGGMYAGATTRQLTLTGVSLSENDNQYRCVATNSAGTATSNPATLNVNPAITAPTFNQHPTNETVAMEGSVSFTVVVSGNPTPDLRWQVSTNGTSWSNVPESGIYSGVSTDTLTLTDIPLSESNKQFRCVATNQRGSVNSNAGILTVTAAPIAPMFTTHPVNQYATDGGSAQFIVEADGNPLPSYQWQVSVDGGATWEEVAGAASNTLTLTNVSLDHDNNQYRCVAANTEGSVNSQAAVLSVGTAPDAPAFTMHPTDQNVEAGGNASFNVAADSFPLPSYQWQISSNGNNWSNITDHGIYSGATTDTLILTDIPFSENNRRFRCVATNPAGTSTSNTAILTVSDTPGPPYFITQPANKTVTAGKDTSFTVTVGGYPAPIYKWQVSIDGGETWLDVESGTGNTLTLTGVPLSYNNNRYRCVVENNNGVEVSEVVILTVTEAGPVEPGFIPVSDITGVPVSGTAGVPLTLSGVVTPSNATNRNIAWTVVSGGTTGAVINGSILNTNTTGSVTVRATITNGLTTSSNFIKDFVIDMRNGSGSGTTPTPTPTPTLAQGYALTVQTMGGGRIIWGSGTYNGGASVILYVEALSGYRFDRWVSSNGGTFANAYNAYTDFTMPHNATTVTAHFVTSDGSYDIGGGSGSSKRPVITLNKITTGNATRKAHFYKDDPYDISVELVTKYTLRRVRYGTIVLKADVDYFIDEYDDGVVVYTLAAEFLSKLGRGDKIITFDMNVGGNPQVIVSVK